MPDTDSAAMASPQAVSQSPAPAAATNKGPWAWHPPLPLEPVPVFVLPPRPAAAVKYLLSLWFLGSLMVPYTLLAAVTWFYLQPALARSATLEAGWILQMGARNLALMVLVAGGLHLYFYSFKKQGRAQKYDHRDQSRNDPKFLGRNQVLDNVFWTCASGVTLWTVYEAGFIWGYATGGLALLDWNDHPVGFALVFLAIPFWNSFHFYCVHRLLHWRPLYKLAHALHHRNVNVGPWSGLSMHPIEHVLYFSSVLIHLVIPSHPMHVFFHMQFLTLAAATSHTGFAGILVKEKTVFRLGAFHHQLHHRFFDCNYGNEYVPCDRWFGSDHDGTPEATARLRGRA